MIATIKETIASLKDPKYGQIIVKKTVGESLWYWTKYLLTIFVVILFVLVGAIVYFTPQLPKILGDTLPDIDLDIKNGQASSSVTQPYVLGDKEAVFILNTKGTSRDLDSYKAGVLILKDQIVTKNDVEIKTYSLKDTDDFHVDKQIVITWVNHNKYTIVGGLLAAAIIIGIFTSAFLWTGNLLSFLVTSALLWLFALIIRRKTSYLSVLKIVIHASVLPLIISVITFFSPGSLTSLLNLGVFLLYSCLWIYNLPTHSSKKA